MKIKGSTIFTVILLAILLIFVLMAFSLSSQARQIPLIIGTFTLGLICLQFFVEIIPKLSEKIGIFGKEEKEILGTKQFIKDVKPNFQKNLVSNKSIKMGETKAFLWLLALVCLVFAVGYLIAIPLFLFIFFKFGITKGWIFSIITAVVTLIVVYFSFVLLLKMPLYKGLFFALH